MKKTDLEKECLLRWFEICIVCAARYLERDNLITWRSRVRKGRPMTQTVPYRRIHRLIEEMESNQPPVPCDGKPVSAIGRAFAAAAEARVMLSPENYLAVLRAAGVWVPKPCSTTAGKKDRGKK